ncbi:MAG TPA: hypothetical protein VFE85_06405 [Woeseiaceae bacterium]|nr:hypothetical protein [Woeseiaceae bacterium]
MKRTVTATTPGKVVLCGEYAVLHGAPAVCMAVDRHVEVTAVPADDDCLVLAAPGYREGRWRFRTEGARIRWLDALPAANCFRLFELLWTRFAPPGQWALTIDSTPFVDAASGRKLGLGASAATAVAVGGVLAALGGDGGDEAARVAAAHRDYQGGRGSGVDVACCRHGGVIEYRMHRPRAPGALAWPAGLARRFLWSGVAASTVDKLRAFGTEGRGARRSRPLAALARQAAVVAACWRRHDSDGLLEALPGYVCALRALDVDRSLGIFDAGHARLADMAPDRGVAYKPCGAGGGDVGVVFARTEAAAAAFAEEATRFGFRNVELSMADRGMTLVDTPGQ